VDSANRDARFRQAAFDHVNRLAALRGGVLESADLAGGFLIGGNRFPLINPQRGIFKPRQMEHLLSIKTVFPRKGGRVWYDDSARSTAKSMPAMMSWITRSWAPTQTRRITAGSSMRCSVKSRSSIFSVLRPVVISPLSRHSSSGWHPEHLRVQLAFGALVGTSPQAGPPETPERRYALREVKARLHQASFRDAVLAAYGGRCAISHIPEPRLLDAAHIVMDADEQLGQPIVSNGLPLTKLHHAAFDANLIGIDPDYRIHVSDRLLDIHDGPFLELGLKGIAGTRIERPRRLEDAPDRDRLAIRFEQFKKSA
jgi:putative restriction endonuclease